MNVYYTYVYHVYTSVASILSFDNFNIMFRRNVFSRILHVNERETKERKRSKYQ